MRNSGTRQPRLDGRLRDSRPEKKAVPPLRMTARLWALLRPFRGSMVLLLVLSLGAVAIDLAPPMLLQVLVDRVLQADRAQHPVGQLLQLLLAIVAALLLARLAATLVAVWKGWVSSRVGTTLTANLRNDLVAKLNELPLAFYDRNQVGVLMSQVAYDTETLHTLVYHMTSGFLLQSLQLVGIGFMMLHYNAKLALVTLLPMPLILAGSWYFTRYLQPRHQHYWAAVGKQASSLMGMLAGIRVVKAFVQEDREIRRFGESSRRLRDSRLTVENATVAFTAAMGLLFALGGLVVWYIGGRDVLFGSMTLGSLTAFLALLAMFYTPLTTIAESTTWFASFYSTSRRMCALLDVPSESEQLQSAVPLDRFHGGVEFQHVSFGYDRSRPVLEDISFAIEPGEMVGVVGRSGSGKSTLVSLIGRLYECDAGQIRIDGIDVRQANPWQLRRQIGMVPQEPFLFRGSVAANIAYGNGQATPEQILLAARNADSHEFIMRMPFAYETQLGEGGSGLSGGERQRLSIARALLFDPAILILDEATASVDAESERAICQAIRRWVHRRTTIVIAHRLSTLQGADRLLVFDQGRLVEQGTPAESVGAGRIVQHTGQHPVQPQREPPALRIGGGRGCGAGHRGSEPRVGRWGIAVSGGAGQRSCVRRCPRAGFRSQRGKSRARNRLARSGQRYSRGGQPRLAAGHPRPAAQRIRAGSMGFSRQRGGAFHQSALSRAFGTRDRGGHASHPCRLAPAGAGGGSPIACPSLLDTARQGNPPTAHQRRPTFPVGAYRWRTGKAAIREAWRRVSRFWRPRTVAHRSGRQLLPDPGSQRLAPASTAIADALPRRLMIARWLD